VADWYRQTATLWRQLQPGRTVSYPKDLPVYYQAFPTGAGKVVSAAAVTPERLANISSAPSSEGDWDTRLNFIRPFYAGIATTPADNLLYCTTVASPPSWQAGDKYFLRVNSRFGFHGPVYLNGKQIGTYDEVYRAGWKGLDVTSAINLHGENTLVIATDQNGMEAMPDLWRQPKAMETMPITGKWSVRVDDNHLPTQEALPGSFTGLFASKNVTVPATWKGSHVFIRISGNLKRYAINNKMFFYSIDTAPLYMDITPWVKFGQQNTILIESGQGAGSWTPGQVTLDTIQLEKVPHV
jgi:hypothetical protein